jgi:hypothetical protein
VGRRSRRAFALRVVPALTLSCAGRSNGIPVSAKDCTLSLFNSRQIGLTASLFPRTDKVVRSSIVVIDVSGDRNEYRFDGRLTPNRWTTQRTLHLVAQNSYDLHQHLGSVDCYDDAVTFSDGKTWFGGTPDISFAPRASFREFL